jgi:hypothetical protein
MNSNRVWVSFDKKVRWLYELDQQHLSNILWFMEILGDASFYRTSHEVVTEELKRRFGKRSEYRPHPIPGEIQGLVNQGLVTVNGNIYGNSSTTFEDGKIVGSLDHIKNWQKLI